jgi:hypothetical protein
MVLYTTNTFGEWIPLSGKSTDSIKIAPLIKVLSDDENCTLIQIDISGFLQKNVNENGEIFQNIDLLSDVFTIEEGKPYLPYIAKIIAVPDQASITYEIVNKGKTYFFKNINLIPSRKSVLEGTPENPLEKDIQAYNIDELYPNSSFKIESPQIFRDFRIVRFAYYPLRYNALKKELEVTSSVTIKINYGKGQTENIKTSTKRDIAPSFGTIYKSTILNYESILKREYGGKEAGHDLMLCIMPDMFVDSFAPYANWKRKSGIDIHITKFSDIGATSSNPVTIKNHITDAYHNWDVPPTYVLMIGDDGVFPKKIVNYDYSFPNEDYFVEIDGNDFFPEMMIGRFTNQEEYRMRVMLKKFLLYEREPYIQDQEWFRKAVCCSNNYYESQVDTKRFTKNVMLEDGNFISVDTLMSDGDPYSGEECSMDNSDVINAINNGRSFLNYRGEGWSSGWWATCTPLQTNDLSQINNGQKFTFVTSIGCGVAMFDASGGNCFGEEWVEMGTLTSPRGGVAFVGPTSNTHTTYNNKIDKGIYVGMFREKMDTPGQALLRGKLYLYNVYGTDPLVEYHYRIYCILGDPAIHIWKDLPLTIMNTYTYNEGLLSVNVRHETSGLPVDSAQVTITGTNSFFSDYTDPSGNVTIDIGPVTTEALTMTVRGSNVYPKSEALEFESNINEFKSSLLNIHTTPNPFIENTSINYSLSFGDIVSVNIFDIKGQLIKTLQNGYQSDGNHTVSWDGTNNEGRKVCSGIYYFCLSGSNYSKTQKIIKL